MKWGGSVMRNLLHGGFEGAIYHINPRSGRILGVPAYAAPVDLSETPDLVIVALGGVHGAAVVAECGRRRVPAVVVISAGFGEAGDEGSALQQELARTA